MLCLTRYPLQKIVIGKREIIITVIDISPGKVKLGFEAPPNITVHREEIYDMIHGKENACQTTENLDETDSAESQTDSPPSP